MEKQPNFKIFVREYCKSNNIQLSTLILNRSLIIQIKNLYNIQYGIKSKEIA
jgi:hypothetical protein